MKEVITIVGADKIGVDFIGGFSALVHKGYTCSDQALIQSIHHVLSSTDRVCSLGLDMIAVLGDTSAKTISAISADEFIHRGGRLPAPVHSVRN